jgi:uncharacterized protein
MNQQLRVALIKSMFDAFLASGGPGPLLEELTDDAEIRLTIADGTPLSGVFRGKEGLITYFTRNEEVVEIGSMEATSYLSGSDQVAVIGRETLTVRRSGRKVEDLDWVVLYTFRSDKICKIVIIEDTSEIAAAYR